MVAHHLSASTEASPSSDESADRPRSLEPDRRNLECRDRDALRRENRRLRSRVYALESALNYHERRRQGIVDQYERVLDDRTESAARRSDRRSSGRTTGPLERVRRALASAFG